MRKRLLSAMLLVAGLAVLGFGLPLALSVQALYRDEALLMLSEEAARAAVTVPASFSRDDDLPELPEPAGEAQLAVYDASGRRVVGTGPLVADAAVLAALRGGTSQTRELVVALPVSEEESVVGAVRASLPEAVVQARTRRTWAAMAALAAVVLAAAGALAARRSRHLALPLATLRADAAVIGAGGELPRRPATGVPEFDAVHAALADAAGRLNASLVRERSFSADLAHQLRTPLASLRLRLETEQHQQGHRPVVDDALADVDRLQQTLDDLVVLARDADRSRVPQPLEALLADVAERWEAKLVAAGRRLTVVPAADLPWVEASPSAVRQILDVLLDNALTHGAGLVTLSARGAGQGAVVAVADEGNQVVDPERIFVRRGEAATGSGIGLSLARRLAEAEGLRLVVADAGPGAEFHLAFPGSHGGG